MNYKFASSRKVSFIVQADGQNWLVQFGDPNQSGVCAFMTSNKNVAHAVRRHAMSRRGVIKEVTDETAEAAPQTTTKTAPVKADETTKAKAVEPGTTEQAAVDEREYDNYTVAREALCKEFDVNKSSVRNPEALSQLAKEHGIIIKYKEL